MKVNGLPILGGVVWFWLPWDTVVQVSLASGITLGFDAQEI